MSDQFKASFAEIEKRPTEFSLKTNTIDRMQPSVHEAVVRQQTDLAPANNDIERVVTKALSDIEILSHRSQRQFGVGGGSTFGAPRERDGPKLNDARKAEVADLTDSMPKASFVLWRDNLDFQLEEFADFGLGTNEFLKRVRLHTDGTLTRHHLQEILGDTKQAGSGSPSYLGGMDIDRANRELCKFDVSAR